MMLINVICITFDRVQNRPKGDVCKKFKEMSILNKPNSGNLYPDQGGSCSPKLYDKTFDNNEGLMQFNYVRWMVGYERNLTLSTDPSVINNAQYCSIYCAANSKIGHYPVSSEKCYSSFAANGCGKSNLAYQMHFQPVRAPGFVMQLLDDYIDGYPLNDLGHRRWMLSPHMVQTMFGAASNLRPQGYYTYYYTYFTMSTFDTGISVHTPPETLPFYAWPPPGYVHSGHVYKIFSFSHDNLQSNPSIEVKVDGVSKTLRTFYGRYSYMQPPSLSFTFDGVDNLVNKKVDVKVTSGSNTWEYTIYPVDCTTWREPSSSSSPKTPSPMPKTPSPTPKTPSPTPKPEIQSFTQSKENPKPSNTTPPSSSASNVSGSGSENGPYQNGGGPSNKIKKLLPVIIGVPCVIIVIVIIAVTVTIFIKKSTQDVEEPSEPNFIV